MLNDTQKTALRKMIATLRYSPEQMEAIGADDAFALTELQRFVQSRTPELEHERELMTNRINEINLELALFAGV